MVENDGCTEIAVEFWIMIIKEIDENSPELQRNVKMVHQHRIDCEVEVRKLNRSRMQMHKNERIPLGLSRNQLMENYFQDVRALSSCGSASRPPVAPTPV